MANLLKIKRSAVAGRVPSDLSEGELAINIKDKKMFFLDSEGAVQSFDLINDSVSQDPSALIYQSAINTYNQNNTVNLIHNTWL